MNAAIDLAAKQQKLEDLIWEYGNMAVAFSGGVDSTFLLQVAHGVLGERLLAVTARSSTYPEREYNEAVSFVRQRGIRHVTLFSEELDIEGFAQNPQDRCYFCKKELYAKIFALAKKHGVSCVADGTNFDDLGDYRPGMKALAEFGVVSPLLAAGLTKAEIRELSKQLGLPTWDKQSFACLASRFPYGQEITKEKLTIIEQAEQYLLDRGLRQVRVRCHGDLARIEVDPGERQAFFSATVMNEVNQSLKNAGFAYVTLDLQGYRTGSLNEQIL
jgi:uncharacterized protein